MMSFVPKDPTGGGSRKQRAAALKAEMEAKQAKGTTATEETTQPQPGQQYTLKDGDTLESIAKQVDQDPEAIWNHDKNEALRNERGSPEELQAGDTLFIPGEEKGTGPVGRGDYVVKQGDCMASIAVETGHFWETIWNHSDNAELKEIRKDPYTLLPEDRVTIPELRPKEEAGETEMRHRFVRRGVPEKLIVVFKIAGEPRANQAYVLEIDGTSFEGTTDPNGRVEAFIPPNAKEGRITFRDGGGEYELDLGDLDPVTEISGVQGRLGNLGFYSGRVDGQMNDELEQAILRFQDAQGLDPSGQLDKATQDRIEQAYQG